MGKGSDHLGAAIDRWVGQGLFATEIAERLRTASLTYGIRLRAEATLRTGALAVVVAAWYFGVEQGGAIGAVLALAFTAGLLFWLSTRIGRDGAGTDELANDARTG